MELFKRTGSDDFPSHLKMMISGPPKSGKTTLLGSVPNIVIADTEPHANNLQSIAHKNVPYVTIQGSDDLQRLLFVLRDETFRAKAAAQLGLPAIEAVAVDTLDTLQSIMKKERMRATGKDFLREDWGWIKEQMTEILQAFTSLPMHVFFTVHTKSKEIGKGDDTRTIILPGLEGSIAESIAGLVGYSVLAFRKEEIRQDGSKYTKYWLRTEGDETYDYLGTRTAGRLSEIIEPDFATILKAALDGRPTSQAEPVALDIQTTQVPPQAPAPAQPVQTPPAGDDEPMNAAALMHVKKTYDALGLTFPEETIKGLNLGQARQLVQTWRAAQQDAAEGKGGDAKTVTRDYLAAMGWLHPADVLGPDDTPAQQPPPVPSTLEEATTIAEVLAWAADDLQRIQQAYDAETTRDKPRSSLVDSLVRKGAKTVQVPTPVQTEPVQPVQPEPVQPEPVQPPEPAHPETLIQEPVAQAIAAVEQGLNGKVTPEEITEHSVCVVCGNTVDDVDIAKLSDARYHKVLCVNDYIAETKKIAVG